MRTLATTLFLLGSIVAASAAGGFSCEADDEAAMLALSAGTTHGMGSAMFSFTGKVELRSDLVEEDLRATAFSREHVPQYWLDDESLKVRLYRERDGDAEHGYVEAVIETAAGAGDYRITVYDMKKAIDGAVEPVSFTGRIACSVE